MLMRHVHPKLQFTHMLPYGAILHENGVQFVVFSRSATAMRLLLYDERRTIPSRKRSSSSIARPTAGAISGASLFPACSAGQLYHFQADGPHDPEHGQWFDGNARLIDPYAKALAGNFLPSTDGIIRPPKCVVVDDYFDWEGDRHLRRSISETIIYETHVRGFTKDKSSEGQEPRHVPGPDREDSVSEIARRHGGRADAGARVPHQRRLSARPLERPNYWGYDPMAFFAPHRGYARQHASPAAQVNEFKQMVKALHAAGIEVILDVVFNHTCEGNELGPTLSASRGWRTTSITCSATAAATT